MKHSIKNEILLNKILWLDALAGGLSAIVGLIFTDWLTGFLGLPSQVLTIISIITLVYAAVSTFLAYQSPVSLSLLRLLVSANWVWAVVSIGLTFVYFPNATTFGVVYLILQVVVVGGLAYLEGNQILKT